MKVKTSPRDAPPLASRAVSGLVLLLSSNCARVPAQLAGDSRKTVTTLTLHVSPQEKHRHAKDHDDQNDPHDAGHDASRKKPKNVASEKLVSHINACSGLVVVSSHSRRCSISSRNTNT